ncbi:concanavalin A-like lectin/glucanase superfamily protein [Streptomyces sp. 840.1]|uniref:LamG-like jellyroll fold domain-containing protein n=1 Tax=Streptomyces sp. 840.1 TaxID=2485152 RepID=UPI000F4A4EAE|nr:LamG-like jellyroll fold domain-containing protein [Streptomyces sp. 840.1]ROQ69168.1 concanavalin A-like lectin/glucanase superfamily protein [Streptomyces sp. 840.1]
MPTLVEVGWGGQIQAPSAIRWTDLTARVDQVQGVRIDRGASDELSEIQPGSCTMVLDNADGALTPGNPNSPYYPNVRRNAPIRVSQAVIPVRSGAAPYSLNMMGDAFDSGVADPSMWTTANGAVQVGGRLRLPLVPGVVSRQTSNREWSLAGAALSVKLATPPGANGSSSTSMSMWVYSQTTGTRLRWSYNAVNGLLRAASEVSSADAGAVSVPYDPIAHAWLRIRETTGVLFFETSPDGWDWTICRSLATPAWVNTNTVQIEFNATRTGGTADYVEWDLLGARVRPRFYGMVNEWPVQWEGLLSTVSISATDLFKRLNRQPPLRSMLGMEVLTRDTVTGTFSFPAAYFPLAEPVESAAAGSVVGAGIGALASTQVGAGGTLVFGEEGVPETGESAVSFTPASATAGRYLVGDLGPQMAADSTTWAINVQVWIKTSTAGRAILGLSDPLRTSQLVLSLNSSGVLTVESTQDGTALVIGTSSSGNLADGAWHHVVYDGSAKRVYVDGAAAGGILPATSSPDLRTIYVGGYRSARLFSGQIAHLSLHLANGPVGSVYAVASDARTGFSGESSDWRVERLARYAGLESVTLLGSTFDPVASQGPTGTSIVARLQEVEATESGRLYAERDYYGLAYQSRDLRYNPSAGAEVFAISYADVEPGIQLADDDQKLCNQVEASRPNGATQIVTDASSVEAFGVYEQQLTVLKTSDSSVADAASWLVSRYADPAPELREVPIEAATMATFLDILDADISSYFTVYDLPAQSSALEMRVTVEGYTETLKENSHLIEFRTSASARDSIWILDDPEYSVLGSTTRLAY